MDENYINELRPYVRFILQLLGYAIVAMVVMAIIYQDKVQQYLDENWNEMRCEPYVIPFAGFSTVAPGDDYMDKVNKNFQYCTGTQIKTAFPSLFEPFVAFLAIIKSSLASVSLSINTFRKALTTIRVMFAALVKNTIEKMGDSYAAAVFLQEKMKNIVKRQAAAVEVMRQFLTAFPFIMESLMYGPIPRFAVWLSRYMGFLISSIVICILCQVGGPFVMPFACPACALCFTPTSTVGTGSYRKLIRTVDIGNHLDNGTRVTGIIYFGPTTTTSSSAHLIQNMQMLYPLHNDDNGNYGQPMTFLNPTDALTFPYNRPAQTWVTGSHSIYDPSINRWTRVGIWAKRNQIKPVIGYEPLICLITSNHTIPVGDKLCGDYDEISDAKVLHALCYQRQCIRNDYTCTDEEIVDYVSRVEKQRRSLHAGMTYEQFTQWVAEYDPDYVFPARPSLDTIRRYFYQYNAPHGMSRQKNIEFRSQLRGFRIDHDDKIVWYRIHGGIFAENTLLKCPTTGQWMRVFEFSNAVRLNPTIQQFTFDASWIIHVYTYRGDIEIGHGNGHGSGHNIVIADAQEVTDETWTTGELSILTNVSNIHVK